MIFGIITHHRDSTLNIPLFIFDTTIDATMVSLKPLSSYKILPLRRIHFFTDVFVRQYFFHLLWFFYRINLFKKRL
jgi:hypothetical protein